jgi:predicted HicB family RNase H-like nuclease
MKYSKVMLIRVTKDEYRMVKTKAKALKISMSAFIRMLIRGFA